MADTEDDEYPEAIGPQPPPKEPRLSQASTMHIDLDFYLLTEADGDVFTATTKVVFDQIRYVFEKLQQKGVKVKMKMTMMPHAEVSTTTSVEI